MLAGVVSWFSVFNVVMTSDKFMYLFGKAIPAASLLLSMVISSFVGTAIPMFFKKIKVDPAVASGPLITTVNDLVAVVTYYGLSWLLLLQIMHLAG